MKKYIFVILLIISSNTSAVDIFLDCNSDLAIQGISTQVATAIKNICSYYPMGYKALFTITPKSLPSDFYKRITESNFYIFDEISDTIYLTFNNLMAMLYLQAPDKNKGPFIYGSDIEKAPNYPWLQNWFNATKSVGSVNALVKTNTEYVNYFFDGVNEERRKVDLSDEADTYKYALIGVCVASAVLLATTNLINYLYMKNHKLKQGKILLLNSEEEDNTNPI
jgi:hypothetical protein